MQAAVSDLVDMEGRMRKLLIIFAVTLLPSFAMAHGYGGGGHMGGWSGGHMGGAWAGRRSLAMTGGRLGGLGAANWKCAPLFRYGRFVDGHQTVFVDGW